MKQHVHFHSHGEPMHAHWHTHQPRLAERILAAFLGASIGRDYHAHTHLVKSKERHEAHH